MEKIDMTPKWSDILPMLFKVLEEGNAEGKKIAREELMRLANAMDDANSKTKND